MDSLQKIRKFYYRLYGYLKHHDKKYYRFNRTIACFFDEHSLQLATARHICHLTYLLDVNKIYLPRSLESDEDKLKFLGDELQNYINNFGNPFTRYILGVGGSESAFRTISLPNMRRQELNKAVYFEGNKRIPFGLDNAYYGYHISRRVIRDGLKTIFASLIAVSKKEVDSRSRIMEPLRVKIDGIHHELEAIGHLLPYVDGYDNDRTYALINIKAERSEISFYRSSQLEFMHISAVGSDSLASLPDTPERFEYFTQSLVGEIQNSLDYYIGQFSNTSTEHVYIYGDLSYSDDLVDNLSKHFGIEFKRFPVEQIVKSRIRVKDLADQIPVSLSAVGLAMNKGKLIDFTPPEIKEHRADIKYLRYAVPSFLILVTFLISWWMISAFRTELKDEQLSSVKEQIQNFEDSHPLIICGRIKRQMSIDQSILKQLNREPTYLHLNLKELSRLTPEQIKLDQYNLENEGSNHRLNLYGRVISFDPPPEVLLAEYIVQLQSSPFYKNVELDKHSKTSLGDKFEIEFQLLMDAII